MSAPTAPPASVSVPGVGGARKSERSFCSYLPRADKTRPTSSSTTSDLLARATDALLSTRAKVPARRPSVATSVVPTTTTSSRGDNEILHIDPADFNILFVDRKIRDILTAKISTIPTLRQELERVLWILNNSEGISEKVLAKQHASSLRSRIRDIEGAFELALYDMQTSGMVEKYRKLQSTLRPKSFITHPRMSADPDVITRREMNEIALAYLRISQKYIDISGFHTKTSTLVCSVCSHTKFRVESDSMYVCLSCGNQEEIFDENPSYRDTDRVNMANRYKYTRPNHFATAIDRFQGKQNTTILPEVYDYIRSEMHMRRLTPEALTKDHVYMLLSNGFSEHYDDINLIHHVLTGKVLPDISTYATRLMQMLEQAEEVYERVKRADRINSMNVNYKLYKLLQLLGYPCRKDDFYTLRTQTRLAEHDEVWSRICEELGWNVLPTV